MDELISDISVRVRVCACVCVRGGSCARSPEPGPGLNGARVSAYVRLAEMSDISSSIYSIYNCSTTVVQGLVLQLYVQNCSCTLQTLLN